MLKKLKVAGAAHVAALRHGRPAKRLKIIFVIGSDGARLTTDFLAAILRGNKERVGVITPLYVQIADERVEGSDQAHPLDDPFRLQALLAQMRKARCAYVVIELPLTMPPHRFTGITPHMVIVRRCGDAHVDAATVASRVAFVKSVLAKKPKLVVANRDDPAFGDLAITDASEFQMTFGAHQKSECRITNVELHPKGSGVSLLIDHQTELQLGIHFTGKQAIYSAVAAAAAAYILHVPTTVIEDEILAYEGANAVLEKLPLQRPYQIMIDAAATPEGLAETLEAAKHFARNRLLVVLSSPLGQLAAQRPLLGELVAGFADRLIVTDGEFTSEESAQTVREQLLQGVSAVGGDAKTEEVPDRFAAFEKVVSIARRGDIVVVVSTTLRPYRLLGGERLPWNDRKKLEELFSL